MKRRKPIYVESRMQCSMEDLWGKTQDPKLHQRWDLRFGEIDYQPKVEGEPQRFTYATVVAPQVRIAGSGESLGDKERPNGARWSGLKFWSDDWRSPVKAGAGYWRYLPTDDGIRFLTRFDYQPRWGQFGEWIDRFVFRPAFGWATAWSFDRLRLWLERGIPPEQSRDRAIVHAAAVTGIAASWLFQGLVPKILHPDPQELEMVRRSGFSRNSAPRVVKAIGVGEAALGLSMIAKPRSAAPFIVHMLALPVLTAGAWRVDRPVFFKAFNPLTITVSLLSLGVAALATREDLPSGFRPLRTAPDRQPTVDSVDAVPRSV